MKKILLLSIFFTISSYAQIVNIPDVHFKNYLMQHTSIDTNGDSELQVSEAQAVTSLGIGGVEATYITDLTGIEAFTNLSSFAMYEADSIEIIDLSNNPNLSELGFTFLPNLTCLNIHNGNSSNINPDSIMEAIPNLAWVCSDDSYSSFLTYGWVGDFNTTDDCSQMSCTPADPVVHIPRGNFFNALVERSNGVDFNHDHFIELSETYWTTLTFLSSRDIQSLEGIEHFVQLVVLDASNNSISSVDLSANIAVQDLYLSNNLLEQIDVSSIQGLQNLDLSNNRFTTLDFSNQRLLSDLSVQNNPYLTYINIKNGSNEWLTTTNFTNLPLLEVVCVDDVTNTSFTDMLLNQIGHPVSFVDTNCGISLLNVNIPDPIFKTALLSAYDTNSDGEIQTYEVNSVTELLVEAMEINDMTGIEAFTSLEHLNCMENNLTHLDVSNNLHLTDLECQNNMLTELLLDDHLQSLNCSYNQLDNIDLQNANSLNLLYCNNNLLLQLDISNTVLVYLSCHDNPSLTYINLKNGANQAFGFNSGDFTNLPNLTDVCVDDLAYTDLTNFILNEVGHSVNFTDDCSTVSVAGLSDVEVQINPNPVTNVLNIQINKEINKIFVYDISGKLVLSDTHKTINIENLNNGVYFVKILTKDKREMILKFIKN